MSILMSMNSILDWLSILIFNGVYLYLKSTQTLRVKLHFVNITFYAIRQVKFVKRFYLAVNFD